MRRALFISVIVILSSACGEGTVVVNLTDAPVEDVEAVNLRVTGVELQRTDGTVEVLDFGDRTIDLLALTAGNSTQLVSRDDITAGDFSGVRLLIEASGSDDESTVTPRTGGTVPLQLSGGNLLATRDFNVEDEESTTVTIDVDLRRSLFAPESPGGNYLLSPTLRLVQNNRAGSIAGSVSNGLATDIGCDEEGGDAGIGNVVYVFAAGTVPDDIDNILPEPITTARAVNTGASSNFDYVAAFLPEGDYVVAFTCRGEFDELQSSQDLAFTDPQPVTVTAGQTATANFQAP